MDLLRVRLFGGLQIDLDGTGNRKKLTHTTRSLLIYLLLFRNKTHSRDILANIFWKEYPQNRARNCLNTALWRLRRSLEPKGIAPGTYLISTPVGELGFNTRCEYWLDVDIFERGISRLLDIPSDRIAEKEISILEAATQIYRGDLLEGYYYDWILRERERLHCCYLDCLYYLMFFFTLKEHVSEAIAYGKDILANDPLREDVHRHLVRLYMKNGQRCLAVQQYRTCQQVLSKELGIPPMEETQDLYRRIMQFDAFIDAKKTSPIELQKAFESLHRAVQCGSRCHSGLQHAME
jgi:DNA-binding SARP family transcriptional activator